MSSSPIDINAMAASIYQTIMNVQKSAEQMVGLDVLWCRAIPHANSEDVIVQEYTLSNVDCPQPLRVIQDKSDYQPGAYNLDLFGMSYENPLEISINIESWQAVYGTTTVPQKGDIVLVKVYNRLYEVASMTIQYMLQSVPQYYKCTLTKYQRKASRKESQEIKISIDELTNAQDILFGDTISNEVADAVVERETSYNQSTHVDPIADFDLDSIIADDIYGINGNKISSAYYDFTLCKRPIVYKGITASYNMESNDPNTHWIYTCWFRYGHHTVQNSGDSNINSSENKNAEKPITITGLYSKDKNYYKFTYSTTLSLKPGDSVVLTRGTLFTFTGYIEQVECDSAKVLCIATPDVLAASKRAREWWNTLKSGWKIKKTIIETADSEQNIIQSEPKSYNIFSAYSGIQKNINFSINSNTIVLNFGNVKKTVTLRKELAIDCWHYICLDFNLKQIDIKLIQLSTDQKTFEITDHVILNKTYTCGLIKGFMIDNAAIENANLDFNICNIRLYESEYALGDKYKLDMYSEITRNASKLILVDNPLPANKMKFVSTIK